MSLLAFWGYANWQTPQMDEGNDSSCFFSAASELQSISSIWTIISTYAWTQWVLLSSHMLHQLHWSWTLLTLIYLCCEQDLRRSNHCRVFWPDKNIDHVWPLNSPKVHFTYKSQGWAKAKPQLAALAWPMCWGSQSCLKPSQSHGFQAKLGWNSTNSNWCHVHSWELPGPYMQPLLKDKQDSHLPSKLQEEKQHIQW